MTVVIPRQTWAPRHPNGCETIGTQEWVNAGKELWLHHSVTNPPGPDATLEQDCAHMREFEAIGHNRYGCGISYTWVVMPSGRVFQGHDVDRQGTHTYGRNNRSRAICLAGNYQVNELPQRMHNAVARLLRELGATLDGGHRNVFATACPGDHAYERIPSINQLASSGAPIDPEDDMFSDGDRITIQAIWSVLEALKDGYGERRIPPNQGEELKQVKHWYEMQHELRRFLALWQSGSYVTDDPGPITPAGEDFPVVALLKELADSVAQIKADVAELKEGQQPPA